MTDLLNQTIAASTDDAFACASFPNHSLTQTPHFVPNVNNQTPTFTGYIFTLDTAIPDGATIDSAVLSLYWTAFGGSPAAVIKGERASNPATYSTSRYPDDAGIVLTTASVAWTMPSNGSAQYNDSPDIKTVIQDIMDNKGDSADLSRINIIISSGATSANFHSVSVYDTGSNLPLLSVSYTAGVSGPAADELMASRQVGGIQPVQMPVEVMAY